MALDFSFRASSVRVVNPRGRAIYGRVIALDFFVERVDTLVMRLLGYVRVSGIGQKSGDGPLRQKDAITAFCDAHKLYLDPAIYEEAITGVTAGQDRPEFSRMIARIAEIRDAGGEIDGFVLERADRLARDLVEGELIFRECRKRNIKIFATDRGLIDLAFDDGDATIRLIRQVIGAVAEFEKSALVKKLKLARERIKRETGRCEGRKPYGTLKGEAQCLQVIGMLHAQGDSDEKIANAINSLGFKNRSGGLFTRQSIRKQLKHKKIAKL